jgi:hypothetical protein
VLIIRYEDMLADAAAQLQRVLKHVGMDVDPAVIQRAVDRSNVATVYKSFANHQTRDGSTFAGGLGGGGGRWRHAFSTEDLALFLRHAGPLMRELGYDTAIPPLPPASQTVKAGHAAPA